MLGSLIGSIHHVRDSRAAQVTTINLEMCGLPPNLRLDSLRETGKTILETPAIWLGSKDRVDSWFVDIYGEALLRDSVSGQKGVLILLPHLGNWELFNVFFRRFGTMTALYQPPRTLTFRNLMSAFRQRHGNEMVATDHKGLRRLYQVLQEGGTAVVLPDQVPSSGHFIPFFGEYALTDELPIRLQNKTGARLLMLVFLRRLDGFFDVHIKDIRKELYEGDKMRSLASLNKILESFIALEPSQYQWEYKRFRERPAGAKKVYRFNKPVEFHR